MSEYMQDFYKSVFKYGTKIIKKYELCSNNLSIDLKNKGGYSGIRYYFYCRINKYDID